MVEPPSNPTSQASGPVCTRISSARVRPSSSGISRCSPRVRTPGLAEFPDSVTARGARHLAELADMAAAGARAAMLYLVQIGSARRVAIARDIDPAYGKAFDRARAAGVEALARRCRLTHDGIDVAEAVAIED